MTEIRSFDEATRESVEVELDTDGGGTDVVAETIEAAVAAATAELSEKVAQLEAENAAMEAVEPLPRETGDDTSSGSADDVVVPEVEDVVVAPEAG